MQTTTDPHLEYPKEPHPIMKWFNVFLMTFLLVLLVLVVMGYFASKIENVSNSYEKTALTVEGRTLLAVIKVQMAAHETNYDVISSDIGPQQTETRLYAAGFIEPTAMKSEWPPMIRPSRHWWGDKNLIQAARAICPDCVVAEDGSYKAIAIGNLDDDADLDVWILRKGAKAEHIRRD